MTYREDLALAHLIHERGMDIATLVMTELTEVADWANGMHGDPYGMVQARVGWIIQDFEESCQARRHIFERVNEEMS